MEGRRRKYIGVNLGILTAGIEETKPIKNKKKQPKRKRFSGD